MVNPRPWFEKVNVIYYDCIPATTHLDTTIEIIFMLVFEVVLCPRIGTIQSKLHHHHFKDHTAAQPVVVVVEKER